MSNPAPCPESLQECPIALRIKTLPSAWRRAPDDVPVSGKTRFPLAFWAAGPQTPPSSPLPLPLETAPDLPDACASPPGSDHGCNFTLVRVTLSRPSAGQGQAWGGLFTVICAAHLRLLDRWTEGRRPWRVRPVPPLEGFSVRMGTGRGLTAAPQRSHEPPTFSWGMFLGQEQSGLGLQSSGLSVPVWRFLGSE